MWDAPESVVAAAIALEEALIAHGLEQDESELHKALTDFLGRNLNTTRAAASELLLPVTQTRPIPEWDSESLPADTITWFNERREMLLDLHRSLQRPLGELSPVIEMTPFPVENRTPQARLHLRKGGAEHRLHIYEFDVSSPQSAQLALGQLESGSAIEVVRARSGKVIVTGAKMTDRTTGMLERGSRLLDRQGRPAFRDHRERSRDRPSLAVSSLGRDQACSRGRTRARSPKRLPPTLATARGAEKTLPRRPASCRARSRTRRVCSDGRRTSTSTST
jgi:hypothetical protein